MKVIDRELDNGKRYVNYAFDYNYNRSWKEILNIFITKILDLSILFEINNVEIVGAGDLESRSIYFSGSVDDLKNSGLDRIMKKDIEIVVLRGIYLGDNISISIDGIVDIVFVATDGVNNTDALIEKIEDYLGISAEKNTKADCIRLLSNYIDGKEDMTDAEKIEFINLVTSHEDILNEIMTAVVSDSVVTDENTVISVNGKKAYMIMEEKNYSVCEAYRELCQLRNN